MLNQTQLRDITETEVLTLSQILSTLPVPRKRHLKAALNTAVFSVFSLAGFCIFWFVASIILAAFTNIDIGISSVYSSAIFIVAIITALAIAINSTKNWLANSVNDYGLINTDIKARKIADQTFSIQDVKCFKEPEHGGLLYFLLLSSDNPTSTEDSSLRIRAIYDYESQNVEVEQHKLLVIKQELTISTAPHSQFVLSNTFKGQELGQTTVFDLAVSPTQWPKADSWFQGHWNMLETQFGKRLPTESDNESTVR